MSRHRISIRFSCTAGILCANAEGSQRVARIDVIKPYVEKVVAEYLGTPQGDLHVDDDGSIPIRRGSTAYFVRLLDGEPPLVQVYSTMLYEVPKSPELLERLNEINAATMFAKAFWTGEQIVVATEMVADSIDKDQIANACGIVGSVADHYDDELQETFGGKRIFNEAAGPDATPEREGDDLPGYM